MTYPSRQAVFTGLMVTAALTLAACGGGDSGSTNGGLSPNSSAGSIAGQTITLYNGQHEQTTDALVEGVREADRRQGQGPQRRRGRARPADRAGGIAVAGRRVLHREHPAAGPAGREGPARAGRRHHPGRGAGQDSATDHNWVGVSARVSMLVYNTDDLKPADLPTSIFDLADPKWKGKLDIAPSETDFQPIVTSVAARPWVTPRR